MNTDKISVFKNIFELHTKGRLDDAQFSRLMDMIYYTKFEGVEFEWDDLSDDPMLAGIWESLKYSYESKAKKSEYDKQRYIKKKNVQDAPEPRCTGIPDKEEEDFAELMDNLTTPTLSEDAEKVLEMYNAPYTQGYAQHSWEMKHKVLDKVFPSMSTADKDDIIIELDNYLRTKEIA